MGDGSFAPGFDPVSIYKHQQGQGQPYVYSGYWGRPVYANELPDYEKTAYGFQPPGGSMGGVGNPDDWAPDPQIRGQWINKKTGQYTRTDPRAGGGGGGFSPGGGGYSGAQSYAGGGMGDTAFQQAASNAIAQMYNRIRSRKQTAVNTDMARRGISSSGVAGGIMGDAMHELDLNEAADIAKIWQQGGGSSGMSSSGGSASSGAMGPGNMGGFGARLPGFNPGAGGRGMVVAPGGGGNQGMGQLGGVGFTNPYAASSKKGPSVLNGYDDNPFGFPR